MVEPSNRLNRAHIRLLQLQHSRPSLPLMHLDRDIPSVDSPTTMDVDQPPPHSAHCTAAKYTGSIPLLIIEILCAYLKDVLHSSESLLGFPDPLIYTTNIHHPYRGLLDDANRHLLSTISLVHRSWTTPAQSPQYLYS